MEFTKLSEVAVVETANDTDKVLIEQNGEIKRVPKTEVGGAGGGMLIINANMDTGTGEITASANMTLDEALTALNNHELSGAICYVAMIVEGQIMATALEAVMCADYSMQGGFPCLMIMATSMDIPLMWTADGFTVAD